MDLSEARGLVLFRVIREGIGITQRLSATGTCAPTGDRDAHPRTRTFYKGECQGKYLSLDRSRKTFPWLPAPLTIEDAGLVLCPSDLGAYVVPSQQMHLLQ